MKELWDEWEKSNTQEYASIYLRREKHINTHIHLLLWNY